MHLAKRANGFHSPAMQPPTDRQPVRLGLLPREFGQEGTEDVRSQLAPLGFPYACIVERTVPHDT
jgi:hypothetical protein